MKRKTKRISGIYTITYLPTGCIYVGRSVHVYNRFCEHKSWLRKGKHSNPKLQSYWNKYTEECFLFELLEECDSDLLVGHEHYWCNLLGAHNNLIGFNHEPTNPNQPTRSPTPEEVAVAAERFRRLATCEVCGKTINYPNYKKYHGEKCGTKYTFTEEVRKRISEGNKGKTISQSQRDKVAEKLRGRKRDPEIIKRGVESKIRNNLLKNNKI